VAETSWNGSTATLQKEYGYRDGEMLIVAESATVRWLVTDHLGTPRILPDQTGSLSGISRHDYFPFGEENLLGAERVGNGYSGGDTVRQKYTGYERDTETNLDFAQARYHANLLGRFTSVDPLQSSAESTDPQSWNRFSYVGNRPLVVSDPSGLIWAFHAGLNQYQWFDKDRLSAEDVESGWVEVTSFVYYSDEGYVALDPHSNNYQFYESKDDAEQGVRDFRIANDPPATNNFLWSVLEMMNFIPGGGVRGTIKRTTVSEAVESGVKRGVAGVTVNRAAGIVAEKAVAQQLLAEGNKIVASQVVVRTSAGIRIIDHLIETPAGKLIAVEVKTGGGARTAIQLQKDALMATEGAVIISRKVPELRGRTRVIETIERRY